jgi:putative addiction module killer protein
MTSAKPHPEFAVWRDGLDDKTVSGVIVARIKWLASGLTRDVQPVGEGVSELRIHVGAGWPDVIQGEVKPLAFCALLPLFNRDKRSGNL